MDAEKWIEIKEIFNEAIELSSTKREIFLNERLKKDSQICLEVEKLIAADEHAETLFDKINFFPKNELSIPTKIGNYQIIRKIGEGGMGVVYLAERHDLKQKVALKMIVRGADSEVIFKRFRREQEILATLEHPNIARLIDVGVSIDGTPFLAMEYVEGEDLTEFSRRRKLSLNEKLSLYRKVCEAVSYAHSRLIVHRDLKPSNIIVNENGEPKLLDFGISKLISEGESNADKGTVTSLGMLTPNYASPEQFRGETVSTATDIYSLGVILYELLTDSLPYQINDKRIDEIARAVIEINPPKPSEAVISKAILSNGIEFRRKTSENEYPRTSGDKIRKTRTQNLKFLRGDLDNILLKALRKEPARRYSSVEQFSEDLRRHLEGLPVTARPDKFSYRAEKFIGRNRVSVVAGIMIFFILIGGIAATGWQAYRAEQQRIMAEQRFNQVRDLANNIVFKYYDEAEKLPNSTALREMFVRDSLDYFDSLVKDENADQELRIELGKAFLRIAKVQGRPNSPNLGDTAGALENYRKGIDILEPLVINSTDANLQSDLISSYSDYAVVLKQNGNFSEADKFFQKSIHSGEVFLSQNPDDTNLASRLALGYMFWGDSLPIGVGENENIAVYKKSLAAYDNLLKTDDDNLRVSSYAVATGERAALALITLAKSARFDGNTALEKQYLEEAKPLLERNVQISEKMVRQHPNQILPPAMLASAQLSYGTLLIEMEDYALALEMVRKSEKFYRASMETDKISVGQKIEVSAVEQRLAVIYSRTGKTAEADSLYAHAIELLDYLVKKDAENFDYVKIRGEAKFDYADELLRRGETAKARQIYESAFNEMLALSKKKDSAFAASLHGLFYEKLGNCHLSDAGNDESHIDKAISEYQKTLEIWKVNEVLNITGIRQDEKLAILERKINRLKT